jgi:serine/alanine racemase
MVKMPWKPVYGQLRKESLLIYTSHILFARILFLIFPDSHMAVFFFTMASSQAFASLVCAHLKQYPALQALV